MKGDGVRKLLVGDKVNVCNVGANGEIDTRCFREFVAAEGVTFVFQPFNRTLSIRVWYSEVNAEAPIVGIILKLIAVNAPDPQRLVQPNNQCNRLILLGTKFFMVAN